MSDRYEPRHLVPSWAIISIARYGLGRSTYICGMTQGLIREHYPDMHPVDQQVLIEDMEAQARIDEQITRPGLRLEEEITGHANLLAWCKDNRKEQDDEQA